MKGKLWRGRMEGTPIVIPDQKRFKKQCRGFGGTQFAQFSLMIEVEAEEGTFISMIARYAQRSHDADSSIKTRPTVTNLKKLHCNDRRGAAGGREGPQDRSLRRHAHVESPFLHTESQ